MGSIPNVTPQSEAVSARKVRNDDVRNWVDIANKRLISQYKESVYQWIMNKQQLPAGTILPPIPEPPASYVLVPHNYTIEEKLYDASYPGIEPMIDDSQTGPPVTPKYGEPGAPVQAPPGTVEHVGPFQRDDKYTCMPDDNMPDGHIAKAKGMHGEDLKKVSSITPFGTSKWYEVVKVAAKV